MRTHSRVCSQSCISNRLQRRFFSPTYYDTSTSALLGDPQVRIALAVPYSRRPIVYASSVPLQLQGEIADSIWTRAQQSPAALDATRRECKVELSSHNFRPNLAAKVSLSASNDSVLRIAVLLNCVVSCFLNKRFFATKARR